MNEAASPVPDGRLGEARLRRYAMVDLAGIRVRRAQTEADFALVASLRETGFSRVADQPPESWIDDFDRSPGVFSLIAWNDRDEPVATMRVQDGRVAELELSRFVPLARFLDEGSRPAAQFARLSVINAHQRSEAMFGLFKAAWRWCLGEEIRTIVIATPPWSRLIYDAMFFEDLGPECRFEHRFAGGALHTTMMLPVFGAESIWRSRGSPLCTQIFDIEHPSLAIGVSD